MPHAGLIFEEIQETRDSPTDALWDPPAGNSAQAGGQVDKGQIEMKV